MRPSTLTNRDRFHAVLNFQPFDRLPLLEWATWWNLTIDRWHQEGLEAGLTDGHAIARSFGLDSYRQAWFRPAHWEIPKPARHGAGYFGTEGTPSANYERLLPWLYPQLDRWPVDPVALAPWAEEQRRGETVFWITLDGFFWWPRQLFGIEPHFYAFYDEPELMKRINEDLARWHLQIIDRVCQTATPDFMTFAEDLSYNNGPMLSEELFDEFMLPYYTKVVPELKRRGIRIFIDSDGDITKAMPWFEKAGLEGVLPLERQAGVDIDVLRRNHPKALFIGHFDKMTMTHGEAAMRAEFERLLPAMRMGGYIPSVDHQTPPGVSLDQYRVYLRLLSEYAQRAAC